MQFALLSLLALTFAAPISVETSASADAAPAAPTAPSEKLQPLIYLDQDGTLWVGSDSKQMLSGVDAHAAVSRIVQQSNSLSRSESSIVKRDTGAIDPKVNFCCGRSRKSSRRGRKSGRKGSCCDTNDCNNDCNDPCAPNPCDCEPTPEPCKPCPEPTPEPCAPCDPTDPCGDCYDPCYDPCNPCDDPCDPGCSDGSCCDELQASCYTKWFCPSTYCNGGEGICPEECNNGRHPVVDSLRSCCATKWLCPSTYCPSNWCGGCGSDDSCNDPCKDSCNDPCNDPCYDPCADPCA